MATATLPYCYYSIKVKPFEEVDSVMKTDKLTEKLDG